MALCVGDKIRFKFDIYGCAVQERVIGLANGRYYAFDTDLMCACHVTDTLEEMMEKYNQFEDVHVIKKKRKGED